MTKINNGRFKKGHKSWNNGMKGIHLSPSSEFKRGEISNEKHPQWKGDKAGYTAIHMWLRRHFGKPNKCEFCGEVNAKKYEWANISGEYKRVREDYKSLCVSCHRFFDGHAIKMWKTRRGLCLN